MSNQDAYKRRIEIVKYLQDKNLSTGQLAEYFDVDDRTIRSDVDALRMGYEFLGTILKIESKHEGSQKHFYKSTVHPIFLGMNLSELYMLLTLLEGHANGPGGEVYENILQNIYNQLTDYAESRLAPRLKNKYEKEISANYNEKEAFHASIDYKLMFWAKSGNFIEVSFINENKRVIDKKLRLNGIEKSSLKVMDEDGNEFYVDYGDVMIDWSKVKYK